LYRRVFWGITIMAAGLSSALLGARQDAATDGGRRLFSTYCASCHGRSGRGDGLLADALRMPPPNLTELSQRNGGVFPSARARRIIDGRDVGSHGSPDMPVWGDAFRRREGLNDAEVKARIESIIRYLDSIQHRTG
jgi:mono/diheme cytochrome c family protein